MLNIDQLRCYWNQPFVNLVDSLKDHNYKNEVILWYDGINVLFEIYLTSNTLVFDYDNVYEILSDFYIFGPEQEPYYNISEFCDIIESIFKKHYGLKYASIGGDNLTKLKNYYK